MGIEAVLVLLLVVSPGLIADEGYRFLLWRPDPNEGGRLARGLILSAAGFLLLLFVSDATDGAVPFPPYLESEWWSTAWTADFASASGVALGWLLHTVGASLLAGVGVFVGRRKATDRFVRWVAGQSLLARADRNVDRLERVVRAGFVFFTKNDALISAPAEQITAALKRFA